MPLNSLPPTTTVANLEEKRQAAIGQCHTDVGFWGGVIPGNQVLSYLSDLRTAAHQSTDMSGPPQASCRGRRQRVQVLPDGERCRCMFASTS